MLFLGSASLFLLSVVFSTNLWSLANFADGPANLLYFAGCRSSSVLKKFWYEACVSRGNTSLKYLWKVMENLMYWCALFYFYRNWIHSIGTEKHCGLSGLNKWQNQGNNRQQKSTIDQHQWYGHVILRKIKLDEFFLRSTERFYSYPKSKNTSELKARL